MQWKSLLFVCLGAFLTAFGLEMFLTPNGIIVGGVKGLSGILSRVTEMHMGLFLFFLNLPFFLAGPKKNRTILSIIGLIVLSVLTIVFHPFPPLIENPPLAAFCGSLILGVGVGLILRYAGLADGVDRFAAMIKKRIRLSAAEIVTLINIVILSLAGFVFGWGQAIYSIFAYMVAIQSARYTFHRLHDRAFWLQSRRLSEIERGLRDCLGNDYRPLSPSRGVSHQELFFVTKRKHAKRVREVVFAIDPDASIKDAPFARDAKQRES